MISFTRPVGQETNNLPEGVSSYTMYATIVLEGRPLNAQYCVAVDWRLQVIQIGNSICRREA